MMTLFIFLGIPVLAIAMFVSWIWLTSIAFRKSPLWGAALILLMPFSGMLLAISYWQETKKPFLIHMGTYVGFILIMLAIFSSLGGFEMMEVVRQLESGEISEDEIPAIMEQQLERMEDSPLMDAEDRAQIAQMRAELRKQRQQYENSQEPIDHSARYEELMRGVRASNGAEKGGTVAGQESGPVVQELPPVGFDPMRMTTAGASGSTIPSTWDPLLEGRVPLRDAKRHVGRLFRVEVRAGQEFKGRLVDVGPRDLVFEKYMSGGWVTYEVAKNEVVTLKLRGRP